MLYVIHYCIPVRRVQGVLTPSAFQDGRSSGLRLGTLCLASDLRVDGTAVVKDRMQELLRQIRSCFFSNTANYPPGVKSFTF